MSLNRSMILVVASLAGCGGGGGSGDLAPTVKDMAIATTDLPAASPDLTVAGTPDCMTYCTAIMANCNSVGSDAGVGATQQYTTLTNCMNSCKAFPVGALADMAGNTLGCRTYHANAAKGDPVTHCSHAGPGGDGICGTNCTGYCQIAMMYCTKANNAQIYSDLNDCMTTCAKFPDDVKFSINVQGGKHLACLLYHAQEASTVPPDHCNGDLSKSDGGILSMTCM